MFDVRFFLIALALLAAAGVAHAEAAEEAAIFCIHRFLPEKPLSRALRPAPVSAVIENRSDEAVRVRPELIVPAGVRILTPPEPAEVLIAPVEYHRFTWEIEAAAAGPAQLRLEAGESTATLTMRFLPPLEMKQLDYIPEPVPAESKLLVGAHHCPLWEADRPEMWSQLIRHPERTPALGFYAQENPEVADWETKWAVEHGIDFFIYCWYRIRQGGPVEMNFGSAIHDAFFNSRFVDKMKFTIMWENQRKGISGVADEQDLFDNLIPFWMKNYFTHPSYLKVDNKPVLFIYRPEFLIEDLGGIDKVAAAFEKMRQVCRDAGFDGLWLLGEYRGSDEKHLRLMKALGLDYTFAYVWYIPDNPTPEEAIASQMKQIRQVQEAGIIPQVTTVSQAWSGWHDEGTIWKIPPADFKTLLRKAVDYIATIPEDPLGNRMLLLDNWNEWGEGHYIAPYREYGFGYVDAVREVLTDAPPEHADLIPEDIGLGPYDTAYREHQRQAEEIEKQLTAEKHKGDAPEKGLVAWWAFDEEADAPVAFDYSGHGLGGAIHEAQRAPGIDGNAMVCCGGNVKVPADIRLSPPDALSITCWIKSGKTGQGNTWFLNRIFAGGTSTGYRMGLLDDKACFAVPVTEWSHHLTAPDPVLIGEWIHLAGVFDGQIMRLYVNGREAASMARPGPVHANDFPLCLGNFETGHAAFFHGLLDEVKLYNRALPEAEIEAQYQALRR
jgi:hypothetical protein